MNIGQMAIGEQLFRMKAVQCYFVLDDGQVFEGQVLAFKKDDRHTVNLTVGPLLQSSAKVATDAG